MVFPPLTFLAPQVDNDGTLMGEGDDSSSSDEGEDGDEPMAMDAHMEDTVHAPQQQQLQGPVVDEEGFTLVQGKGGRRGIRR